RNHLTIHHKIVICQSLQGRLRQDDARIDAWRTSTRVGLCIPINGRAQTIFPFLRLLPPLREQRKKNFSLTRHERVEPRIRRATDSRGSKGLPRLLTYCIETRTAYGPAAPSFDEGKKVGEQIALFTGVFAGKWLAIFALHLHHMRQETATFALDPIPSFSCSALRKLLKGNLPFFGFQYQ